MDTSGQPAMKEPTKQFYRVATIAKMLDVSKGHVWGLLKAGTLHPIKLSQQITVVRSEEVDQFITSFKQAA